MAFPKDLLANSKVRWDICPDLEKQADFPSKHPLTFPAYQAGAVSQTATAPPSGSSDSSGGADHR